MELDDIYHQETELKLIKTLLPYVTNKTFLDIGAEKGTFTKLLASHSFIGVMFEPLPKFKNDLENLAKSLGCNFLNYAIDSYDREAIFYQAYDHEGNSIDYFSSLNPLTNDTRIVHKETCSVICRSLNSLVEEGVICKHYGLVKTDTEGNDLNILNGMSDLSTDILICEFFMPGLYAGWSNGNPLGIIDAAKRLGFNHFIAVKRFYNYELASIDINAFCGLQWGNLIFIKDEIFNKAKNELYELVKEIENELVRKIHDHPFRNEMELLNKICEQRYQLINKLALECENLQKRINNIQKNIVYRLLRKIRLIKK